VKEVIAVPKAEHTNSKPKMSHDTATGIKVALWWLRHFEAIIHFWPGFSWAWVIGILLYAVSGHLELGHALGIIILIGVIANTGIYLSIRTLASYLKQLEDGPKKEEAHELMRKIIKRRTVLPTL
jgi:hypothetical protein